MKDVLVADWQQEENSGSERRPKELNLAQLNADTAELARAADAYADLATRASSISPRAAAEVQRIADTHGLIGYPAALGIATGLAHADPPLHAKAPDFQTYSRRLTEHATTYATHDREEARSYRGPARDLFGTPVASGITLAASGGAVIVWCVPTPAEFRCTNLFSDDRSVVVYPSPTDRTGGWLP